VNAKALTDHLHQASSTYRWNKLSDQINVGTAMAPEYRNILNNGKEIKLELVINQAWWYFGNGGGAHIPDNKTIIDIDPENFIVDRVHFFKCVRSEMIAKNIEGCLTKSALKRLKLHKDKYTNTLYTQWRSLQSCAYFGSFKLNAIAVCRRGIEEDGEIACGGRSSGGDIVAIGGPMGIAVMRTNKLEEPYLVLHHISPTSLIPSLAFQPMETMSGNSNVLLAVAKGNEVLVWDASGRALSPLLGRLTCYNSSGSDGSTLGENSISCVKWKDCTLPFLLTISSKHVSLWDLRCWHSNEA